MAANVIQTDPHEVADLLDETNLSWMVTGSVAANLRVPIRGDERPTFYVSDVEAASEAIGLPTFVPGKYAPVITLLPFDGVSELGSILHEDSELPMAADDQILIDCFGGLGRMIDQAEAMITVENGEPL